MRSGSGRGAKRVVTIRCRTWAPSARDRGIDARRAPPASDHSTTAGRNRFDHSFTNTLPARSYNLRSAGDRLGSARRSNRPGGRIGSDRFERERQSTGNVDPGLTVRVLGSSASKRSTVAPATRTGGSRFELEIHFRDPARFRPQPGLDGESAPRKPRRTAVPRHASARTRGRRRR